MPRSFLSDLDSELELADTEAAHKPAAEVPAKPARKTRVVTDEEIAAEEAQEKEIAHQQAVRAGAVDTAPVLDTTVPDEEDETILLHFVEDGFTALGTVWYRGQELEFIVGSPAYNDTLDRFGETWLTLVDNEYEQVERWGKVMFKRGEWRGKAYEDPMAAQQELKRKRMPPRNL